MRLAVRVVLRVVPRAESSVGCTSTMKMVRADSGF